MTTVDQYLNDSFEIFLNELMGDDELLRSFLRNPRRTLDMADEWGLPLTASELYSLRVASTALWDRLTEELALRLSAAA